MQLNEPQFKKTGGKSIGKKRIYIVDDDASVCRALKLLLDAYEFQVETFSSVEDFFSAVPDSVPGCLILDIYMPGLNGWDALQRLYRSGSRRPVVAISAYKTAGLRELVLKSGVASFLQKPVNDQELVSFLKKMY